MRNNMDSQTVQLEAYRLIRRKARNMMEPVDDATLGAYVRGVVDLQTALFDQVEKAATAEIEENHV